MNNQKVFTLLAITSLLIFTGCQLEKDASNVSSYDQDSQPTQPITTNLTTMERAENMMKLTPTAYATIKTNKGDMKFKLFGEQAPELTQNFIELANQGKYEGVPFHRVMNDFMVQTGDFENKNGTGGYSYKGEGTTLADEYHEDLVHVYGALANAKSMLPNSIGSQFYIVNNSNGAHMLDDRYSVFGLLEEGSDVLDEISSVNVTANAGGEVSRPTEEILMTSVEIEMVK
jgi:cyclophilin family peptidyl-prolyl cis-trans isomerase